jgi:hypothetical protein
VTNCYEVTGVNKPVCMRDAVVQRLGDVVSGSVGNVVVAQWEMWWVAQ